jgi:hypothetical protein
MNEMHCSFLRSEPSLIPKVYTPNTCGLKCTTTASSAVVRVVTLIEQEECPDRLLTRGMLDERDGLKIILPV